MKQPHAKDRDVHVLRDTASRMWVIRYRTRKWDCCFKRQKDAIRVARLYAILRRCDLVVHGRDGRIRRKDSYGNDPRRRKG